MRYMVLVCVGWRQIVALARGLHGTKHETVKVQPKPQMENLPLQNKSSNLQLQPTQFKRCNFYFKDESSSFPVCVSLFEVSLPTHCLVLVDRLMSCMQTVSDCSKLPATAPKKSKNIFDEASSVWPISSRNSQRPLAASWEMRNSLENGLTPYLTTVFT